MNSETDEGPMLSFTRLPGLLRIGAMYAPDPVALALDWPEQGWQRIAWTLPGRSEAKRYTELREWGLRYDLQSDYRLWRFDIDPERECWAVEVPAGPSAVKVGWRAEDGSSQCVGYGATNTAWDETPGWGGLNVQLVFEFHTRPGGPDPIVRMWGADSAAFRG